MTDTRKYNESTGASWFWAFFFGPIYFLWHGFGKEAVVLFCLNLILIGFIIAPFMAYPAWRRRADEKAQIAADQQAQINALVAVTQGK